MGLWVGRASAAQPAWVCELAFNRMRFAGCKRPTVVGPRQVSMPTSSRQGGGGAPVLRPTLAGNRRGRPRAAASTPPCPATMGGNREWCLRSGAPPPPCCIRDGVPRLRMPPRCRGRWLGARAQAPFAVAATCARTDGVDGPTPANRKRCPASVGRRTCPGPPALLDACKQRAANAGKWSTANRLSND